MWPFHWLVTYWYFVWSARPGWYQNLYHLPHRACTMLHEHITPCWNTCYKFTEWYIWYSLSLLLQYKKYHCSLMWCDPRTSYIFCIVWERGISNSFKVSHCICHTNKIHYIIIFYVKLILNTISCYLYYTNYYYWPNKADIFNYIIPSNLTK